MLGNKLELHITQANIDKSEPGSILRNHLSLAIVDAGYATHELTSNGHLRLAKIYTTTLPQEDLAKLPLFKGDIPKLTPYTITLELENV